MKLETRCSTEDFEWRNWSALLVNRSCSHRLWAFHFPRRWSFLGGVKSLWRILHCLNSNFLNQRRGSFSLFDKYIFNRWGTQQQRAAALAMAHSPAFRHYLSIKLYFLETKVWVKQVLLRALCMTLSINCTR